MPRNKLYLWIPTHIWVILFWFLEEQQIYVLFFFLGGGGVSNAHTITDTERERESYLGVNVVQGRMMRKLQYGFTSNAKRRQYSELIFESFIYKII